MHSAEESHRRAAASRLRLEFGEALDEHSIAAVVEEIFAARATSRVQQYVPVIAEREARERLRTLARQAG